MASGIFGDREKALEDAYTKNDERHFVMEARAVWLFGLWAESRLGRGGQVGTRYADTIMDMYLKKQDLPHIISQIAEDRANKGVETTAHRLEIQFQLHLDEAKKIKD